MELNTIQAFSLDSASTSLLSDIDEAARRVNEFRPLSPDEVRAVQNELLGERVFSSNAIEGNTLDLRETIEILKSGQVGISKKREATEAINLGKAIEYTQGSVAASGDPSDQNSFLKTHQVLLHDIRDDWAGHYRNGDVMIRGAKFQPPSHAEIGRLMDDLFNFLKAPPPMHPLVVSTWTHWYISRVHPFFDGNGRMSRLWQDLILFRHRLTCAIIKPSDRQEYLKALTAADEGNLNLLFQLVGQRLIATLDKYIVAKQKLDALSGWAQSLVNEVDARTAEARKLEYIRWSRKMEELRFAFSQAAATVTQASGDLEVQVRPYEAIPEETWENIRLGNPAANTWSFKVSFRRRDRFQTYVFFFEKHFWTTSDTDLDKAEPRVSLSISEQGGPKGWTRLQDIPNVPLALRGVFVSDGQLIRKRWERGGPNEATLRYDRSMDAMRIAQEFIGEVLLTRLA